MSLRSHINRRTSLHVRGISPEGSGRMVLGRLVPIRPLRTPVIWQHCAVWEMHQPMALGARRDWCIARVVCRWLLFAVRSLWLPSNSRGVLHPGLSSCIALLVGTVMAAMCFPMIQWAIDVDGG